MALGVAVFTVERRVGLISGSWARAASWDWMLLCRGLGIGCCGRRWHCRSADRGAAVQGGLRQAWGKRRSWERVIVDKLGKREAQIRDGGEDIQRL